MADHLSSPLRLPALERNLQKDPSPLAGASPKGTPEKFRLEFSKLLLLFPPPFLSCRDFFDLRSFGPSDKEFSDGKRLGPPSATALNPQCRKPGSGCRELQRSAWRLLAPLRHSPNTPCCVLPGRLEHRRARSRTQCLSYGLFPPTRIRIQEDRDLISGV